MRFSVLLPTREGGPLLDGCISAVLRSERDDLELVVADNANDDETAEVLRAHGSDSRLVCVRSEEPLPVTENWRAALERSTGDYVMLLNDDDLLLAGCLDRADALLREARDPDCLTIGGFYYIFPDAAIGEGRSYFRDPAFPGEGENRQREISRSERLARVRRMFADLSFDHCLPGMQRTLISRRAIDRLPSGLYRPPFPDIYGLAGLFLTARTWTISPEQLMVFGAGPRSFWHLHFSGRSDEAVGYLRNQQPEARLPGDETLNAMVMTLACLKEDFPRELTGVKANQRLYVIRQVWAWLRHARAGRISGAELRGRLRSLSGADLARLASAPLNAETWRIGAGAANAHLRGDNILFSEGFEPLAGVRDITGFEEWLGARG